MVEGFSVGASGAALPAWSVAFPPQEQRILALAAPDPHSPVYSYAKARRGPLRVSDHVQVMQTCTLAPQCKCMTQK